MFSIHLRESLCIAGKSSLLGEEQRRTGATREKGDSRDIVLSHRLTVIRLILKLRVLTHRGRGAQVTHPNLRPSS